MRVLKATAKDVVASKTAKANIGENSAVFEPVHGSAPKYARQNKVNPVATVFAGKMLLEYLGEKDSALAVEKAVFRVLNEGRAMTYYLGGKAKTSEVSDAIIAKIESS